MVNLKNKGKKDFTSSTKKQDTASQDGEFGFTKKRCTDRNDMGQSTKHLLTPTATIMIFTVLGFLGKMTNYFKENILQHQLWTEAQHHINERMPPMW